MAVLADPRSYFCLGQNGSLTAPLYPHEVFEFLDRPVVLRVVWTYLLATR